MCLCFVNDCCVVNSEYGRGGGRMLKWGTRVNVILSQGSNASPRKKPLYFSIVVKIFNFIM